MGSSSSKAAVSKASTSATSAAKARRQYPSTSSILHNNGAAPPSFPSAQRPHPAAPSAGATTASSALDLDARDPQLASRLQRLGPVQPASNHAAAAARGRPSTNPQRHPSPTTTTISSSSSSSSAPPPPSSSSQPNPSPKTSPIHPSQTPQTQPTTTTNPALRLLHSRTLIAQTFETESEELTRGRPSFPGRTLISAKEIRDVLRMRDEAGLGEGVIEKEFRLKGGVVGTLGRGGVVGNV